MSRTTYLHIGPPKTGTTYLQAGWRDQASRLLDDGLLYPGRDAADQFRACALALEMDTFTRRMDAGRARTWDTFLAQIEAHPGNALLSSEFYARAEPETAERVVRQLKQVSERVHVVITARDLGRQVLASWQQYVKRGGARSLAYFWKKQHAGGEKRWKFWRNQDIPALAQRWLDAGADEVTLVVVGAPGAAREQIWHDLSTVLDVPAAPVPSPEHTNRSLHAVEIEVLRRVNLALAPGLDLIRTANLTSQSYSQLLAGLDLPRVPVAVPADLVEEVAEHSREQLKGLAAMVQRGDVTLVGDLAGLTSQIEPVESHVDDSQVADAAVRLIAALVPRELELKDTLRADRAAARAETADVRRELAVVPSLKRIARRLVRVSGR